MANWFVGATRGMRLLGKSKINGIEYGAILAYDSSNSTITLTDAWQGAMNATGNTTVCFAYR